MTARGSNARRDCPICDGTHLTLLHRQDFLLPGDVRTHYDVVVCEDCGFTFASDLPSAEEYEAYYRSNLKYTYEGSRDGAEALFAMHQRSFHMVDEVLSSTSMLKNARILDVGCSTGELLTLFQRGGYTQLSGVDPTPECRKIANRLYGLEIRTAVLSELECETPYDVVLFANVFEHIPDLRPAARRVASLVKDGGFLFVQVPDAGHFGADMKEPFLEFSIEHINYFAETSLANLLTPLGMSRVELVHDVLIYKGASYPVITSVWRKSAGQAGRTMSDSSVMRAYIAASEARLMELNVKIDALVASGDPLVIWGVGSLTARLLATTNLGRANIVGFVDSNKGHHGKRLLEKVIAAPSSLAAASGTVLVSSFVYGPEIRQTLEQDLHFAGRVITI